MFQSSRIASGNPRLQTSSAFSPSSASTIWKSSPSRIRLATFRMTLESSTTRQVFIFSLCFLGIPQGTFALQLSSTPSLPPALCRQHVRHDFKNAIDIEDDHELSIEAMHAVGKFRHPRIEIEGVVLAIVVGELEHFADLIDQKAVGFTAQIDAHCHR